MDTITELQRIESELKYLRDYLPVIAKVEINEALGNIHRAKSKLIEFAAANERDGY
ncbi:hypothetical protein [Leptospira mayottensis]|uniref:Uncharacterized protein n=1 Tax=Leptospira mayottensis 200901122 TaxID=1193010 RepID=A0AA87MNB1_9LEPT|nr:hypothetical protein [Leptospira mayottensis]EKR98783.1 hypothetical protein LEP1GSC125_1510 [Leptospira mayottensis 200901122]